VGDISIERPVGSGLLASTPAAVLGTISNLSASAGDTTLALTWTAAANATSHQPQHRTGANAYADFGAPLSGAATSVTITGLTNGTAYDVRVIAGDGSTTTTSNVVSRTPAAPPVLGDLDNNLPGSGWSLENRDALVLQVNEEFVNYGVDGQGGLQGAEDPRLRWDNPLWAFG
jgi:hypothetical protein